MSNKTAPWRSWKSYNDWTPRPGSRTAAVQDAKDQYPNAKKPSWKSAKDAEIATRLAALKGEHAEPEADAPTIHLPTVVKAAEPPRTAQEIVARQQVAVRIKALRALKSTLAPGDHLLKIVETEIKDALWLAGGPDKKKIVMEDALQALATAEVTLARSEKHLATALEGRDKAQEELDHCKAEVEEAKSYGKKSAVPAPGSSQSTQHALAYQHPEDIHAGVHTMAATLTNLRRTASFTTAGTVAVNPAVLEELVSQLEGVANLSSAVTGQPLQPPGQLATQVTQDAYQSHPAVDLTTMFNGAAETDEDQYADAMSSGEIGNYLQSSFSRSMASANGSGALGSRACPKARLRPSGSMGAHVRMKGKQTTLNGLPRVKSQVVEINTPVAHPVTTEDGGITSAIGEEDDY